MIVHLFSLVWFSRERWSLARHVFSKNIKKFRTENTENTEKRWASGSEHRRSARILGTPWERRTEVRHVFFPEKPYPAFPLCAPCDPIFFLSKHANLKVGVPKHFFSTCPVFFKTGTKAYRAVAKRKGAYAAMPVWGYRGVASGLTSETHEVSRYAFCVLNRRDQRIQKRIAPGKAGL